MVRLQPCHDPQVVFDIGGLVPGDATIGIAIDLHVLDHEMRIALLIARVAEVDIKPFAMRSAAVQLAEGWSLRHGRRGREREANTSETLGSVRIPMRG